MSSMNHPDTGQLNAYLQNPMGSDYRQLRLHLAVCADCREQVQLLDELQTHLPAIEAELYQQNIASNSELHDALHSQLIEKYIDGQLEPADRLPITELLKNNPQAMKAAMHYASHSARMQRVMGDSSGAMLAEQSRAPGKSGRSSSPGLLTSLRHWLEIRLPVWLTVPTAAALAGVLSIVMIPQIELATSQPTVVAYQDNPVIQFKRTENLPGIGFFSDANKMVKPYDRIKASLAGDRIIELSWPKVENAINYTMQLKAIINGRQISVGQVITTSTQAAFKRMANDSGQRYVWHLNGKTDKDELFSTKGGFVISDNHD